MPEEKKVNIPPQPKKQRKNISARLSRGSRRGVPERNRIPEITKVLTRFRYRVFSMVGTSPARRMKREISANPKEESIRNRIPLFLLESCMVRPPKNGPLRRSSVCKKILAPAGRAHKIYGKHRNMIYLGKTVSAGFRESSISR